MNIIEKSWISVLIQKNNAIYKQAKTIKCEINNKKVTSKYAVYKTNSLWLIVQCKEEFIYTVSV